MPKTGIGDEADGDGGLFVPVGVVAAAGSSIAGQLVTEQVFQPKTVALYPLRYHADFKCSCTFLSCKR